MKIRKIQIVRPETTRHGPLAILIRTMGDGTQGVLLTGQLSGTTKVKIIPGGATATIVVNDDNSASLEQPTDLSSGDVICSRDNPLESADQFEAEISWNDDEPLLPGRRYDFIFPGHRVEGSFTNIKHRISDTVEKPIAAKTLERGEHGVTTISLRRETAFAPYDDNPVLGSFEVEDHLTGKQAGTGKIHFALRRASNIHRQAIDLDRTARANLKSQAPCVLWFTGLSGSGKSTIANAVEQQLHAIGKHTYLLDGDNVRHGLNRDLGFTDADRVENIRRIAEVAKLMADAGLIVIASFISPFRSERRTARELMPDGEFIEVFIDAPLEVCEARDEKGLYAKARAGKIANFTGIDSDYEVPEQPELHLDTTSLTPDDAASEIIKFLKTTGRFS